MSTLLSVGKKLEVYYQTHGEGTLKDLQTHSNKNITNLLAKEDNHSGKRRCFNDCSTQNKIISSLAFAAIAITGFLYSQYGKN